MKCPSSGRPGQRRKVQKLHRDRQGQRRFWVPHVTCTPAHPRPKAGERRAVRAPAGANLQEASSHPRLFLSRGPWAPAAERRGHMCEGRGRHLGTNF